MQKYSIVYGIRVKYYDNPFFQIYQGNFRFEDSVMAKARELQADPMIEKIKVTCSSTAMSPHYHHHKVYSYNKGFETLYVRPAGY